MLTFGQFTFTFKTTEHQQLRKLHALNKKQRVIIFSHKNKVNFRYLCSVVYATNINAMTFSVLFLKDPLKNHFKSANRINIQNSHILI